MVDETRNKVLTAAMRLLAAREHSQQELLRKLVQKGHTAGQVAEVIEQLASQGLQSDIRFVENFINSRRARGQGPRRIQLDLAQHQIPADVVERLLNSRSPVWQQHAEAVRHKKFGAGIPDDYADRMRQAKFLEYRGFTSEQIFAILRQDDLAVS